VTNILSLLKVAILILATGSTVSASSTCPVDITPPDCSELTSYKSGSGLTLLWSSAYDDLTPSSYMRYLLFIRKNGGPYEKMSTVVGVTSFNLPRLQPGTYTLFLQCKDGNGNVAPEVPTNEITVTIN